MIWELHILSFQFRIMRHLMLFRWGLFHWGWLWTVFQDCFFSVFAYESSHVMSHCPPNYTQQSSASAYLDNYLMDYIFTFLMTVFLLYFLIFGVFNLMNTHLKNVNSNSSDFQKNLWSLVKGGHIPDCCGLSFSSEYSRMLIQIKLLGVIAA